MEIAHFDVRTHGRGLIEITDRVGELLRASGTESGLCTVFVRHTSASLLVQENADPTVRADLERFFRRLVPDGDPIFQHDAEGPDDMPSHVRSVLMATSIGIPFERGNLLLGTWQGIYLYEHRLSGHTRKLVLHIG